MRFRGSEGTAAISQGLGALGEGLAKMHDQLYEADRVSQINTGLTAIDQAFSAYNRGLVEKKWQRPTGADGALIPMTFGQIDTSELTADHAAQVTTVRENLNRSTTNKMARDYLNSVLDQKAISNYQQTYDHWFVFHNRELIAQSDKNLTDVLQGNDTPEQKKAKMAAKLNGDVASGIRYANDAAAYRLKLEEQVDSSWAFSSALEVAKKAGYDTNVSDKWLTDNTPFWNGDPTKRVEAMAKVRNEAIYQRSERDRLAAEENAARNKTWTDITIAAGTDAGTLRKFLGVLQSNEAQAISIGAKNVQLSGDFKKDDQSKRYWNDRLTNTITAIENPESHDASALRAWQDENESRLVTILVMAKAGRNASGAYTGNKATSDQLAQMILQYNLTTDATGKPVVRLRGDQLAKLYGEYGRAESSDIYRRGEALITKRGAELKLPEETIAQALTTWQQAAKMNPDATDQQIMDGANNIITPLAMQKISRFVAEMSGWLTGPAKLTTDEQYLLDASTGKFRFLVGESGAESPAGKYFNLAAFAWLNRGKRDFPKEGLDHARPDDLGIYAPEGTPLLYNKDESKVYRYIMDATGRQAVLERYTLRRDGSKVWQPVTAADVAQTTTPPPDPGTREAAIANRELPTSGPDTIRAPQAGISRDVGGFDRIVLSDYEKRGASWYRKADGQRIDYKPVTAALDSMAAGG